MAKITFEDDDLTVEVADGSELIDVVDDVGATLIFGCTAGHCMVCAVRVRAPSGGASAVTDAERYTLSTEELARGTRLGCQLRIMSGHVRVREEDSW